MALTSYYTLEVNKGELKWLTTLAASVTDGIAQDDLTKAERWAFDRINLWIIRVAGETRGAAIVTAFVGMASNADVDPAIRHLAELLSSARILRLAEERNFINQGTDASGQLRRKDWKEVWDEAMALAREIEKMRKTVTQAGTVRRWGMGKGQQGPVVNGPMTSGSLFDDRGTYTDRQGGVWNLPHRHPLEDGTEW